MKKTKLIKGKMNKTIIAIIVMAVLLVGALGYVGYDVYSESQYIKMTEVYQQGYGTAINEIINVAVTCEQVSLPVGNQSINLIAIECLQQQAAAQQQVATQQ